MVKDNTPQRMRIDKWLWAVRMFKTRNLATDACKGGQIKIGGQSVKASHDVKLGEVITIRKDGISHTVRVRDVTLNRMPAQEVPHFLEDLTPPEELERKREFEPIRPKRPKGLGRPTKKERRIYDSFFG